MPQVPVGRRTGARVMRHATAGAEGLTGLGIAFEGLSEEAQERLEAFIEERLETQTAAGSRGSASF